jgi:hypothetical protein
VKYNAPDASQGQVFWTIRDLLHAGIAQHVHAAQASATQFQLMLTIHHVTPKHPSPPAAPFGNEALKYIITRVTCCSFQTRLNSMTLSQLPT